MRKTRTAVVSCEDMEPLLDDMIDDYLDGSRRRQLENHLLHCRHCQEQLARRQEIRDALRCLPAPASHDFDLEGLLRPARYTRPRPRRAFAWGFGSAIAAGLALWLVSSALSTFHRPAAGLQVVSLTPQRMHTVHLEFHAPDAIEDVSFSLSLPPDFEIAGFPGRHSIEWRGRLNRGNNILPLPVVARKHGRGILEARLVHGGQSKIFRLQLNSDPKQELSSGKTERRIVL